MPYSELYKNAGDTVMTRPYFKGTQRVPAATFAAVIALLVMLGMPPAHAQSSAGVTCSRMWRTKDDANKAGGIYYTQSSMQRFYLAGAWMTGETSYLRSDAVTWSPGITVSSQYDDLSLVCYRSTLNASASTAINFRIKPSEEYLKQLKANGLDVEVSLVGKDVGPISLIRDGVSTNGYKTQIHHVNIVTWNPNQSIFVYNESQNPSDLSNIRIVLNFVSMESERFAKGGRHTVMLPSHAGLELQIFPGDDEASGIVYHPNSTALKSFSFGTCPAPTISINGGANTADISFGEVSLNMLKSGYFVNAPSPFSITLAHPVTTSGTSAACTARMKNPRLRMIATTGDFIDGKFTAKPNASAPGNSVVAIQVRDTRNVVLGSSPAGKGPYVSFSNGLTQQFFATAHYRDTRDDRLGNFSIPVTLEAFYP